MLYKFFKINENSLKVLKENELFFSKPINFNDPLDCNPQIKKLERTEEDFASFLFQEEKLLLHSKSDFQLLKEKLDSAYDSFKEVTQKEISQLGILCLSQELKNLLMWSHYADGHTGFCLGIDMNVDFCNSDVPDKENLIKVNYPSSNEIPVFDPILYLKLNNENYIKYLIKLMFATKSIDWKYEKEWRLFVKVGGKSYKFPHKAFRAIYFGLKTKNETKEEIMNLRPDLKYYQANISCEKIGLEFTQIE